MRTFLKKKHPRKKEGHKKRMKLAQGAYIREFIFGIEDGLVSTLGFVVGLTTAAASNRIIIIGGIAAMVAAAISMAAGTYLSIKSQKEFFDTRERRKSKHYHLENPTKGAMIMFISFIFGALIPILPYFFITSNKALVVAALLTIVTLFIFGASKTRLTKRNWFKSGFEMAAVGIIAAAAGLIVGLIARSYFGV